MAETVMIKARYLSSIDFGPFGQKLNRGSVENEVEPVKSVLVIPGIAKVEVEKGEPELDYLKVLHRPFICDVVERHLLTSQAFIPLLGSCGLMLLAPPTEEPLPDLNKIIAVIFDGSEGINIKKGTWHSAPFALSEESNYIMVTRRGTLRDDLQMVNLEKDLHMRFQIVL